MQKITPCLWYDTNAEEAVNFYVSLIKNSRITNISYYGEGAPMPKGTVLTVSFSLDGQEFLALNGGPVFKFTEAVSFVINCKTQEEIDELWDKLAEGGQVQNCGWLKDKYGLSWQIVPENLGELMSKGTKEQTQRVMDELMKMIKLDMNILQKAFEV